VNCPSTTRVSTFRIHSRRVFSIRLVSSYLVLFRKHPYLSCIGIISECKKLGPSVAQIELGRSSVTRDSSCQFLPRSCCLFHSIFQSLARPCWDARILCFTLHDAVLSRSLGADMFFRFVPCSDHQHRALSTASGWFHLPLPLPLPLPLIPQALRLSLRTSCLARIDCTHG